MKTLIKRILNQKGGNFLEMILGVAIGSVVIMGGFSLFKMVNKSDKQIKNIMELDDLIASLGVHLMNGTSGIQVSHLDPTATFYDIKPSEDVNDKLLISGVSNMNLYRVAGAFYSPLLPVPFTDPDELWEISKSPIRQTPKYFRNSYTLQYTNNVGRKETLASRCISPEDYNSSFTLDEVLDIEMVPHVYKLSGQVGGKTAFSRCCSIDTDFPNCPSNDLLPRIFHIDSYGRVKMYPDAKHLKFSYDASFGIYMESAYHPEHFNLRFNVNINDCMSKKLLNKGSKGCNDKSTRKFIEVRRPIQASDLSGGSI